MAEKLSRQIVAEKAIVHAQLPVAVHPRHQVEVDRNFGLPTGLYVMTALGYLGFLALAALTFGNPGLILPMSIFVIFLAMFFGVPAMWSRMKPGHPDRARSWSRFASEGIQTYTGHVTAVQASAQVLILPAIVFGWGVAIVTIVAVA